MKKVFILFAAALILTTIDKAQSSFADRKSYLVDNNLANNKRDTLRELVSLVNDASQLVRSRGEAAFKEFRAPGSRWRKNETYIFVIDPEGNMLVNADIELEGKNQLDLKDINGKPIVRGLLEATTKIPGQPEGWYHYQWPVPGGLLPRWKSSFVQMVKAPSGKSYFVGSGMYNDKMEREFVVDAVNAAVAEIEKNGKQAFPVFHDPKGPFMAKDAYVFVIDPNGVEVVNPAFPNLEGRNLLDLKDTHGKPLVRDMFTVVQNEGSGWVNYMWPKPGESVSTQKSAYVRKAKLGEQWVLVGCGVYLADAPKAVSTERKMPASQLMALVRDAAKVFEQRGEKAFPEFRQKGSRWYRDNTYFFVWTMDGIRTFNAANPATEGANVVDLKDVLGKPFGKMFLDAANSTAKEGWVHYMWPEPGDIFPTWKSSFVRRVSFPSGKDYLVGCGIYNMQMDKAFIEDVVTRACDLINSQGRNAFEELRDNRSSFNFMDVYVFVDDPQGTELVNPAQPSLEGKNLMNLKDAYGKFLIRDYIQAALTKGSAWVDYYWYKPGQNQVAHKNTYVRKVNFGNETYIVGAGFYSDEKVQATKNKKLKSKK
jgi:signal transduction histidine kinase